jgi:hypothetical protein
VKLRSVYFLIAAQFAFAAQAMGATAVVCTPQGLAQGLRKYLHPGRIISEETVSGQHVKLSEEKLDSVISHFLIERAATNATAESRAVDEIQELADFFRNDAKLSERAQRVARELRLHLQEGDIGAAISVGNYFRYLTSNREAKSGEQILQLLEGKLADRNEQKTNGKVDGPLIVHHASGYNLTRQTELWGDLNTHQVTTMNQLEGAVDVLARRASEEPGYVHEADLAFTGMKGILDRRVAVDSHGDVAVNETLINEKVYSVGYRGAVDFKGSLSNRGGERFYAVLYPKGFVDTYGRLISENTSRTRENESDGDGTKAFQVKIEKGRKQIHLRPSWRNIILGPNRMSHTSFFRENAIGVVEFDRSGKILRWEKF